MSAEKLKIRAGDKVLTASLKKIHPQRHWPKCFGKAR